MGASCIASYVARLAHDPMSASCGPSASRARMTRSVWVGAHHFGRAKGPLAVSMRRPEWIQPAQYVLDLRSRVEL